MSKEHELSDEEIANVTGAGMSAQKTTGRGALEPTAGGVEETNTMPGGGSEGEISSSQTGGKGGLST